MKGNTSNKVRLKCPCKSLWGVQYYFVMGRHIFVIEKKVLQIVFTVTQFFLFFISSTSAPKNNSNRRALFSECGGMRGCSGADEYEAGKEKKITVYSLQKTRLHHCLCVFGAVKAQKQMKYVYCWTNVMKKTQLHYYRISIFDKETSKSNMTASNNSVNIGHCIKAQN